MARSSLYDVLRSLEKLGEGNSRLLTAAGQPDGARAGRALMENAIRAALDLAVAVKAAAAGDPEPARRLVGDLRLDEMRII